MVVFLRVFLEKISIQLVTEWISWQSLMLVGLIHCDIWNKMGKEGWIHSLPDWLTCGIDLLLLSALLVPRPSDLLVSIPSGFDCLSVLVPKKIRAIGILYSNKFQQIQICAITWILWWEIMKVSGHWYIHSFSWELWVSLKETKRRQNLSNLKVNLQK